MSISAVERWMATPDVGFPDPDWRLAMGPVWKWTTISAWSRRSGYPKPLYNRSEDAHVTRARTRNRGY